MTAFIQRAFLPRPSCPFPNNFVLVSSHTAPALLSVWVVGLLAANYATTSTADAAIQGFGNRAAWEAAQTSGSGSEGGVRFSSFETSDVPLGAFGIPQWDYWENQGVRFTNLFAATGVVTGDITNQYGFNLAESWGVDPSTRALRCHYDWMDFEVTGEANAVAIELATTHVNLNIWVVAVNPGQGGLVSIPYDPTPQFYTGFFGVVAPGPIKKIYITIGGYDAGDNVLSYVKSFSFGNPIPTPATAVVLLGACLKPFRRRR